MICGGGCGLLGGPVVEQPETCCATLPPVVECVNYTSYNGRRGNSNANLYHGRSTGGLHSPQPNHEIAYNEYPCSTDVSDLRSRVKFRFFPKVKNLFVTILRKKPIDKFFLFY